MVGGGWWMVKGSKLPLHHPPPTTHHPPFFGGPAMVRFLVVMVLALALCAGVAWWFGLIGGDASNPGVVGAAPADGKVINPWKSGKLLFVPFEPKATEPLGDELLPNRNGERFRRLRLKR